MGENNYLLRDYYKLYDDVLYSYRRYLDSVATPYNSKTEASTLKEIMEYEKQAIEKFDNTPIEHIVICDVQPKDIDKAMRDNETFIWDTYFGYRFVRENNKSYFYMQTNDNLKTKNYVSHIGNSPLKINDTNIFIRELYDSTEYMLPPKTAYIDSGLLSFLKINRNAEKI